MDRGRPGDSLSDGHRDGLLPQAVVEQLVQAVFVTQEQIETSWSAPLPQPSVLAQYNAVVPGSADRIIAMAEAETTEKARTDRLLADGEVEATKTGVSVAALLALICIGASIWFFAVRNPYAGTAMLGLPLLTLIGRFIPDRHSKGSNDD